MPAGDKKGPEGEGPMTGRKKGFCTGNSSPGYASINPGRGDGRIGGPGSGGSRRGRRNMFYETGLNRKGDSGRGNSLENNRESLKARADYLEEELERVKMSLDKLQDPIQE